MGPWLFDFISAGLNQPNALKWISDSSENNNSEQIDDIDGTFSWSSSDREQNNIWPDEPQIDYSFSSYTNGEY